MISTLQKGCRKACTGRGCSAVSQCQLQLLVCNEPLPREIRGLQALQTPIGVWDDATRQLTPNKTLITPYRPSKARTNYLPECPLLHSDLYRLEIFGFPPITAYTLCNMYGTQQVYKRNKCFPVFLIQYLSCVLRHCLSPILETDTTHDASVFSYYISAVYP